MSSEKPETGLPCDCGAEIHGDEHDPNCAIWGKAEASQEQAAPSASQSETKGGESDPPEGGGPRHQED